MTAWLETAYQDIRFAVRGLRKAPLFTAIAVGTLALGVGANTAIFSIFKSVVLNQLPYKNAQQLVSIAESDGKTPQPQFVSYATVYDWKLRSHSFENLSLFGDFSVRRRHGGQYEMLRGLSVNYDFFDALGVAMYAGRSFLPQEDRPGANNELILTYDLWIREFGGDPRILGRSVPTLLGSYTVVGILPHDFHPLHMSNPGEVPQVFAPLGTDLSIDNCRSCRGLRVIGRLKPGIHAGQARAELNSLMRGLAHEYPADYQHDASVVVTPLREYLLGRLSRALGLAFAMVALLLLLASVNVASLVLARAAGRSGELALRAALGAGRGRLIRQLLTESLVLACAGGIAGTVFAWSSLRVLAHIHTTEIPRFDEIGPDKAMFLWSLFATLLTAILFGVIPAFRAARNDVQPWLKVGAHSATATRSNRRLFTALVVIEIALAFLLVLVLGLLLKSYLRLNSVNPGYDPRNVLTLSMLPDAVHYHSDERRLAYFDMVAERTRHLPGVIDVGYASTLPLSHPSPERVYIREQKTSDSTDVAQLETYSASPGYFRVMKIPLLRGRLITAQDNRGVAPVALVSETCARTQFGSADPIGEHIQVGRRDEQQPWATIVGIVGDVHQYGLDKAPEPAVYLAFAQANEPQGWASLVIRSAIGSERIEPAVRQALKEVDPAQPVFHLQPMEAYIAKSLADRTFALMLIEVFGALALVLAAVGIYGVTSYATERRTREFGLRMALGARSQDILLIMLQEALMGASVGLLLGFCLFLACTRAISSLLFGVSAIDGWTIALGSFLVCTVVLAASYIPASRASRLDPVRSLRFE